MPTLRPKDTKQFSAYIPEALFHQVKVEGVKRQVTFSQILQDALSAWLSKSPKQARRIQKSKRAAKAPKRRAPGRPRKAVETPAATKAA